MKLTLKGKFDTYYQRWLNKRSPTSRSIKLTQKRIFIIPNKIGLLFLSLVALVFVNGVNYQNNLIFSFSVLLLSIFITAIVSTYQNLSGLVITSGHANSVFVGKSAHLNIGLANSARKNKQGLWMGFSRKNASAVPVVDGVHQLNIIYKPSERGPFKVPKITLFSRYPLGILTCWTWLRLKFDGVAYPAPVFIPYQYVGKSDQEGEEADDIINLGIDDFKGFRKYQAGDSLKHIAWRQFAKSDVLLTKEFEEAQAQGHWLDWKALPGHDTEMRLQILCGWVVKSSEEDREFGLSLPGLDIPVGRGDHHRDTCLRALALYGISSDLISEEPAIEK